MSDYVAKKGTTAMSIIGTALGGLAATGGLSGMFGAGGEANYFTKSEAELMNSNLAKDAKIALLEANAATDAKLVEVYNAAAARDKAMRQDINNEFKAVRAQMQVQHDNQLAINSAQAVTNATTSSALAVMATQQNNIQNIIGGLTKTVIPNSNVCPGFMPLPTYQMPCVGTVCTGTTIATQTASGTTIG